VWSQIILTVNTPTLSRTHIHTRTNVQSYTLTTQHHKIQTHTHACTRSPATTHALTSSCSLKRRRSLSPAITPAMVKSAPQTAAATGTPTLYVCVLVCLCVSLKHHIFCHPPILTLVFLVADMSISCDRHVYSFHTCMHSIKHA